MLVYEFIFECLPVAKNEYTALVTNIFMGTDIPNFLGVVFTVDYRSLRLNVQSEE